MEELTKENTKFWAFGLMGTTRLEDGRVIVESDEGGTINFCNVMCRFNEDIFYPEVETGTTFRSLVEQAFVGSDYNIEAYDDGTSGGDASSSLEDSSSSIFEDLSNDEDIGFLFDGNGGARDILMAFFIPAIALFIFIYGIGKALMGSSSNKSGLLSRIVSNITRKDKKEVLYSDFLIALFSDIASAALYNRYFHEVK